MQVIALIIRLIIAAVFAAAGTAKLVDLTRTRKGIEDFGIPNWAITPLMIFLPPAELALAGLLIPVATVLYGSLGSIALLLGFIVGITANLANGRKPKCNCFGQLHSKPIGWSTLARNCILAVGAGLVLWEAFSDVPLSVLGWTVDVWSVQVVAVLLGTVGFIAITVEGWLIFHLLRQNGRLLLRMDVLESNSIDLPASNDSAGLPIGSSAPAFELRGLSGGSTFKLDTFKAERRPIVLIFSDPDCGPCSALLPDIVRWEREYAGISIVLISRGSEQANRLKIGDHKLKYVLLQKDQEVRTAYQASGTPSAVFLSSDGVIASPVVMGAQAISGLIAKVAPKAITASSPNNGSGENIPSVLVTQLNIGDAAPSLKLPDLGGNIFDLATFKKRQTIVLFWNPSCGFCNQMLPDLKGWERSRSADAPQLLVVSTGSVEANRSMELRSPVVLDDHFATGRAFHIRGTPAAVLVDANGKIASGIANGAPAVFALANNNSLVTAAT